MQSADQDTAVWIDGYPLTAKKAQSRKVWVSFGIGFRLLAFLQTIDQIHMQALNKFAYESMIGRV